jgi:hypothetical protein
VTRAAVGLLLLTGTALADDTAPPPDFFTGRYMVLGRSASGPFEDRLRLDPAGAGLVATSCGLGAGEIHFDSGFEARFFLNGTLDGQDITCQFFSDYDNYPFLACQTASGDLLSLWPEKSGFSETPLDCTR